MSSASSRRSWSSSSAASRRTWSPTTTSRTTILGVAFKEMGLLDEAIAEFQKALRAPEGRLRTSEALGMAFFEKGQFAVCESVLRRAVDGLDGG